MNKGKWKKPTFSYSWQRHIWFGFLSRLDVVVVQAESQLIGCCVGCGIEKSKEIRIELLRAV